MATYPDPGSPGPGAEDVLYPPAVTRRAAVPTAVADAALMPPFSRATVRANAAAQAGDPAARGALGSEPGTGGADVAAPEPEPSATPDARQALAEDVAARLESLAFDLRRQGFRALLEPRSDHEPVDAVLAAVIAGFLARR